MAYAYDLISGGYEIVRNGRVVVTQRHDPAGDPATPIADEDREALAQAAVARLEAQEAQRAELKQRLGR